MKKIDILIVEDENIVAADLKKKLTRMGHSVKDIVSCGEDAIELVKTQTPDLILMDIHLAGTLDGIETASVIKERHDVPVVYLTAHSDQATLSRAKLTGPFGYIIKPFELRDLLIQIEIAIYKHRAERQLREQRELFRITLQSIGEGIIATDMDGLITFINPVAAYLTGWPVNEAMGKPLNAIFRINDEQTGAPLPNPLRHAIEIGRTVASTIHSRLIGRGGREVPIETNVASILEGDDQVGGIVLVFRDISERRNAEAEKDSIIAELKDALAKINTLSGLLPICAACKKIRDDKGYWNQIELYIKNHSDAEFTHGICPDCAKRLYPKYYNDTSKAK